MERIAILGGDARMTQLARALLRDGHEVLIWPADETSGETELLRAALMPRIVLPVPLEKDGRLNGTKLDLDSLWGCFQPGQKLYAGAVSEAADAAAKAHGLTLTDYLTREELAVRNAVPTAEGAVASAMEHLNVTVHGTPCLVIGFGRIGKLLAHDLQALGAQVSVSARRSSDLAWIDAFGYTPLHTHRLQGHLRGFRVIFNTVPHRVMGEELLRELRPDCVLIELASREGFDASAAKAMNIKYVKASGLPGRVAPETAARAIQKTLYQIWEEEK